MRWNVKTAWVVGIALALLLVVFPLVGQAVWGRLGFGNGMMGGWGWGFMPLMMILFWGLVIWGVIALVRGFSRPYGVETEPPLKLLQGRYARGEISREEYEERRRDLA